MRQLTAIEPTIYTPLTTCGMGMVFWTGVLESSVQKNSGLLSSVQMSKVFHFFK